MPTPSAWLNNKGKVITAQIRDSYPTLQSSYSVPLYKLPPQQPASVPAEIVVRLRQEAALLSGAEKEKYLIEQAAAYGREQAQWVPVSESTLPADSVSQIICWDSEWKRASVCEISSGWKSLLAYPYITYWMPRPEPPTC